MFPDMSSTTQKKRLVSAVDPFQFASIPSGLPFWLITPLFRTRKQRAGGQGTVRKELDEKRCKGQGLVESGKFNTQYGAYTQYCDRNDRWYVGNIRFCAALERVAIFGEPQGLVQPCIIIGGEC